MVTVLASWRSSNRVTWSSRWQVLLCWSYTSTSYCRNLRTMFRTAIILFIVSSTNTKMCIVTYGTPQTSGVHPALVSVSNRHLKIVATLTRPWRNKICLGRLLQQGLSSQSNRVHIVHILPGSKPASSVRVWQFYFTSVYSINVKKLFNF